MMLAKMISSGTIRPSTEKFGHDHSFLQFQIDTLNKQPLPASASTSDREWLDVFDDRGNHVGRVRKYFAHRLGIRHKTAAVILVAPDGKLLLQLRSAENDFMPNKVSLSAGGHMGYEEHGAASMTPLEVVQKELREELGLEILDGNRFIPIGNAARGEKLFLKVWKYSDHKNSAVLHQFDERGLNVGAEVRQGSFSNEMLDTLKRAVGRTKYMVNAAAEQLRLERWNIEFCHVYLLFLEQKEIDVIRFADGTASGMQSVTLEEMISMGNDLDVATDSLFSLFFSRKSIAREIEQRLASMRLENDPTF